MLADVFAAAPRPRPLPLLLHSALGRAMGVEVGSKGTFFLLPSAKTTTTAACVGNLVISPPLVDKLF